MRALWIATTGVCLAAMMMTLPANAASECRLYFQYKNSTGATVSEMVDLDQGQVKSLGRSGILYVQNKASHPVNIEITNLWPPYGNKWVTLNASGDQDPPFGSYTGNVTLHKAECGAGAGFASPDQLVGALKAAGVPIGEIAAQLQTTFGQTGQQVAALLRQANFTAGEISQALITAFNTNGAQAAQWLQQAGFTIGQIATALKQHFGASPQQAVQYLHQGDFDLNEVASVLRDVFNASAETAVELLRAAYEAADALIQTALEAAGYTSAQIVDAMVGTISLELIFSGFTGGFHSIPNSTPSGDFPLQPGTNRMTFRGQGMVAVTSIIGLPGGTTASIVQRLTGQRDVAVWDYIHVEVNVPTRAASGTRGTGTLMIGRSSGPTFNWIVQAAEPIVSREPGPAPPGGGTTRLPDLQPAPFVGSLYRVGAATTMDASGDTFTALDPFTGSDFCQGIPEGGMGRNNMPTSNRQQIVVPDVQWGAENTSPVNITTAFTVRLLRGGLEVARQTVNGLPAGERREFTYQRPQSQTTVARVGPGNGCYHVGLQRVGWNDNSGYRVEVDVSQSVTEANENNNALDF